MFIVFLIPGTPKDFLTYFAGLTSMRLPSVLLISTVGTLPSIVTSTMVAAAIGERCYLLAFACLVLAGVLVVAGAVAFKVYRKRCRRKK